MKTIDGKKYYIMREVEEMLGISGHTLRQLIDANNAPAPSHNLGGAKSYYAEEEIELIRKANDAPKRNITWQESMPLQGLYTQTQAAKLLHMPHITFQVGLAKGRIPRPTHKRGEFYYYNLDDIKAIQAKREAERPPKDYLRTGDIAKIIRQTKDTVASYRKRYQLGTKFGREWYFSKDEVENFKAYYANRQNRRQSVDAKLDEILSILRERQ